MTSANDIVNLGRKIFASSLIKFLNIKPLTTK